MIRIFYRQGDKILKDNDVKRLDLLTNIMWVDMQAPTSEEEEWIESKSKISIQTPQEITEIESSSRYFERNNEITANSNFLRLENGQYEKHAVSFIIKDSILYTFRQADLSTFADVVRKMKANSEMFNSGFDVLMSLQETRIDLEADLIERVSNEITIFSRTLSTDRNPNSEFLLDITDLQESTMMLRESMIDKQRVLSNLLKSSLFPEDRKIRLRIIIKDIQSLIEYSVFNFERLEFLQNTLTGLINLDQNKVLKRFTVFSIAFLPPTLISGMFGMNFTNIPGANQPFGFFLCILAMIISSGAVMLTFKKKGWI
jgi:magnesium transporter